MFWLRNKKINFYHTFLFEGLSSFTGYHSCAFISTDINVNAISTNFYFMGADSELPMILLLR